ncbi:MAG: ABC transporter ATP-binding protein [Bacteroidia bacterium]|nr:ABC transporter ATP-binding protein [Bacteroidia bacterium]
MIQEEKIIELNNAAIGYKAKAHSVNVVKSGISVYALKGELVSVIGGNGVGKSTLLRTIAGFQPPIGGEVHIRDKQVNTYREKELALIMSFVSTEIIRVPNLSVFDLVSLGRYPHTNWFGKLLDEDRHIVKEAIKSVGLNGYENRMVNYISDGERQKAMIARTLAQDTDVIVLDEPTAFLDLSNKYEIVHILHQLASEKGKTILFSTHDLTTAIAESDRMWVMLSDSVKQGAPEDLILNGDFASLFHNDHLFFDPEKGDFRIKKQTKRKALVNGNGIAAGWTKKALERNGFEVIDSANANNGPFVTIDVSYPEWMVKNQEIITKFGSLLELCRYLNKV